jgi:AsmA-like protein
MKSPRNILIFAAVAILVAVTAVVQGFNLVASRNREVVQEELRKLLGKEVSFESLEVHLFGRPGFAAKSFRIADNPRFAATPIVRARQLILGVKLWPLLAGRIVVDSLVFNQPEIQIITDETGLLNLDLLSRRRSGIAKLPALRGAPSESKQSGVAFAIEEFRVVDGRVIYLDRSIKNAAELQLRNIDMQLIGLDPTRRTRLRMAAALVEGLGQDVHIDGVIQGAAADQPWLERQLNLTIQLDSLRAVEVGRAIAALRDKIPSELEITGPMWFHATAAGTISRPRFEKITLKAPLFGASDYNAILTGAVEFSQRRSWDDAQVSGKLTIDPLPVARLRKLSWFQHNQSASLVTDGTVSLSSRFEGTWSTLRVGALIRADHADLRYRNWLAKPAEYPLEIRARMARRQDQLFLQDAQLSAGANLLAIDGVIDNGADPKLQLRLRSDTSSVARWSELLQSAAAFDLTGDLALNIRIDKNLMANGAPATIQGYLRVSDGTIKNRRSGRTVDNVKTTVIFNGQQAKFADLTFRTGASTLSIDAVIADVFQPTASYQLRSASLNVAELPTLNFGTPLILQDVSSSGRVELNNGAMQIFGTANSPQGKLGQFEFRNLRADVSFTDNGLSFKNLSLRTFDGLLRTDGSLAAAGNTEHRLQFAAQADDLQLNQLMGQFLPSIRERLEGQLDGRAQLTIITDDAGKTAGSLAGSGQAAVDRGTIKNFNLVSELLLRGSSTTISSEAAARLPPGFAKLLTRSDTTLDSIRADFILEGQRLRSENLVITTPDYTITGAGWLGFDRSTKWNGLIVLSPRLTQEVQRDYRILRYLLDRRGRLAITFRMEGTVPNIKIRLDSRALAQALRGSAARASTNEPAEKPSQEPNETKRWLPDALERFLNR